jgi:hypothetical protein
MTAAKLKRLFQSTVEGGRGVDILNVSFLSSFFSKRNHRKWGKIALKAIS